MIFWEKQKTIAALYEQFTRPVCIEYKLTKMEYDILMFLNNNPQYKTAADIIRVRRLTKSHVSSSLKTLEEKGLITRSFAEDNRKNNLIALTEASVKIISDGEAAQKNFGHALFQGFTSEEFLLCKALFERMCANAEQGLEAMR